MATSPGAESVARRVDERCDRFVEEYAALDPQTATYLGIAGYDDQLTDLSLDGFAAREQLLRTALADVEGLTPVDERERAAKAAFVERTSVELDQLAARTPQWRLNVLATPLHGIRSIFDLMPTEGEAAWADIGSRLAAVPTALAQYRQTLQHCADDGQVAPRRQISALAAQVRSWTGQEGEGDGFFTGLAGRAAGSRALVDEVRTNAARANDAFAELGRYLERDLLARGGTADGVGREQYARDSRYFLGAVVDLDETYAWGWAELAAIEAEMSRVADRIVPGGSVDDAVAALDADPSYTIAGKDRFRDWMQELADRTVSELADTHFDIPEPVRRIECCIAPTSDGGIYYTGPSEDFSRPGRMWWSVPDGITDFSTWREVTTVYHEGVPGHHLQIGQTAYRKDLLNRWQREMAWVSGHGEGWALYAEQLMDELGYLDNPADRLGMLDAQAFRAARVVVDIGMHLGLAVPQDNPFGFHPGAVWDGELGLEFMRQHCRMADPFLRFEVNRYLGWPGQAPSYKVGERIWLAARDDVKRRQGAAFDLAAFHRAALDLGPLGLDPLRESLERL